MKYKNIIFDLGGVIVELDIQAFYRALLMCGVKNPETFFSIEKQSSVIHEFETGRLAKDQFLEIFEKLLPSKVSRKKLIAIWNKMLKGVAAETIRELEALRKRKNIFAISNTNIIHHQFLDNDVYQNHSVERIEHLFDGCVFSYQIQLRKPDLDIFHSAFKLFNIDPMESLFVDDIEANILAGEAAGVRSILKSAKMPLKDFLVLHSI